MRDLGSLSPAAFPYSDALAGFHHMWEKTFSVDRAEVHMNTVCGP
jgi:hypothetical protein